VGCPIRRSRDHRSPASPPGFSQRATSAVASSSLQFSVNDVIASANPQMNGWGIYELMRRQAPRSMTSANPTAVTGAIAYQIRDTRSLNGRFGHFLGSPRSMTTTIDRPVAGSRNRIGKFSDRNPLRGNQGRAALSGPTLRDCSRRRSHPVRRTNSSAETGVRSVRSPVHGQCLSWSITRNLHQVNVLTRPKNGSLSGFKVS
jgi:hypothetical protein